MKPPKKKMERDSLQPLVSVILPFYNAPYLLEAIKSILKQSLQSFELILVDNASTDNSPAVAKSFSSDPRVRLLNEPRQGVVFATNLAIKEARGEFIARMDADDVADHNRLANQVAMLSSSPELGVVSGLIEYLGDFKNEGFIHYVDWLNEIKTEDQIRANQFVEFPMANPSLMFRKEVFEKYGSYRDGDFPEDYELFLRLKSAGVKMGKVNAVVLRWRDTPSRLTRTDARYKQDSFFRIKAKYLSNWLKIHNPYHPKVYLWGAGRLSRRRSDYLIGQGITIEKYIDLKPGNQTLCYKELKPKDDVFIISYVANRGAREEIRSFLNDRGYKEERSYIIAS